jgi:hypothetical protein
LVSGGNESGLQYTTTSSLDGSIGGRSLRGSNSFEVNGTGSSGPLAVLTCKGAFAGTRYALTVTIDTVEQQFPINGTVGPAGRCDLRITESASNPYVLTCAGSVGAGEMAVEVMTIVLAFLTIL